jgi:hypothetical protein
MEHSKDRHLDIENAVKSYVDRLLEIADASIASSETAPIDRSLLRHGRSEIASSFMPMLGLIDKLREYGSEDAAYFADECLLRLLKGAFLIGSRAVIPESAEAYYKETNAFDARIKQAALARRQKIANADKRTE